MSIEQTPEKDKVLEPPLEEEFDITPVSGPRGGGMGRHALNILMILLIAGASFGLGRLVSLNGSKTPIEIKTGSQTNSLNEIEVVGQPAVGSSPVTLPTQTSNKPASVETAISSNEQVVASRNGTKYHYPWCGGAKQIKEENKVFYASPEVARAAGLTPASNCKGLR